MSRDAHRFSRSWPALVAAVVALVAGLTAPGLQAAVSLYPSELYGGMNVVTINASTGVRRLQWNDGDRWIDLRRGQALENLRIVSAPPPSRCPEAVKIYLFVPDVTSEAEIEIRVIECGGAERRMRLSTRATWAVDHQRMRDARVGEVVCQPFSVRSNAVGGSVVVDRIVSPSGSFELRFDGPRPPVRILAGHSYYYQVCFRATTPGRLKMPIHVYVRRQQPNGGFNAFIVADTAYVTVLGPPPVVRPRPHVIAPKPPRPAPRVLEQPRPRPAEPAPPPRIPPVARVEVRDAGAVEVPLETESLRVVREIEPAVVDVDLSDPTTFRTVLLPTARSIPEGEAFVGSYDVAGVLAGYGVTDRLSLLAGGLVVPRPIGRAWTIDATAGARYEVFRGDFTRVAAGLQLNFSDTDSSSILLAAPYVVASVGDDDRRASLALSYTARRHVPVIGEPFTRQAAVIAAGGDLRVGGNWKLAAEAYWIEGSSYAPVVATVRHFGRRWAIDAGVALNVAGEELDVAPVVSLVWVFGRQTPIRAVP